MSNLEDLAGSKILCFGVPPGYSRQLFIRAVHDAGGEITMLSFPGEKLLVDYKFRIIPVDETNLKNALRSISTESFDGAVTYSEFRVIDLSDSAEELSIQNTPISSEVARASRDKSIMKTAFKANDVPTADFRLWTTQNELEDAIDDLSLERRDYILKPRLGTTSEGVYRVSKGTPIAEAIASFQELCRQGSVSKLYSSLLLPPPFLVEEYIDHHGQPVEVAVEGFSYNDGVHVTIVSEKVDMVKSGLFLENKYVSPPLSWFVTKDIPKIIDITNRAVKSLGITNSMFHLEMRYHDGYLKVLEVASRPGGGLISASSRIRVGVDPLLQHLVLNLGMSPKEPQESGISTCFGTLFYQDGFDVLRLPQVSDYLTSVGSRSFYETRIDPEVRRRPIHDWLVAFGVTSDSPVNSYKHFYQKLGDIRSKLQK
jgi:hypothetical protein